MNDLQVIETVIEGSELTHREKQVVSLYLCNFTLKSIAKELGLSESSVRKYLYSPKVRAALEEIQENIFELVNTGLSNAALNAIERLNKIVSLDIGKDNPLALGVQLKAIQILLDSLNSAALLKFSEQRIKAVEDHLGLTFEPNVRSVRSGNRASQEDFLTPKHSPALPEE